jgi:ABC-type thiamin/hydroxymethylpyrimidine transport system permease subunit
VGFLLFSLYLVYKIFRIVKFKDIPLLTSILCITFALIFFLAYNILNQIRAYILSDKKYENDYLATDDA